MFSRLFSFCAAIALGCFPIAADAQDTAWLVSGDPLRGPDVPYKRIKYGPDYQQGIRFNLPRSGKRPALVFLVGDKAWRGGVPRYPLHLLRSALFEDGYAFAATDYRWEGPVKAETMIEDVVAALTKLVAEADELGFDRDRIVLLGNGAGGHVVTLLGTDPSLFSDPRVFPAIKGVVSINGHGFDIVQQIEKGDTFQAEEFRAAFSGDPAVQARLSPVNHLDPPNAPAFMFQSVTDYPYIVQQADGMYRALKRSGGRAAYAPMPPWQSNQSRTYYGWQGHQGYINLTEFLRATLGQDN